MDNELKEYLDKQFENINKQFENINKQFTQLRNEYNNRFDDIIRKLTVVESTLKDVSFKTNSHEDIFETICNQRRENLQISLENVQ